MITATAGAQLAASYEALRAQAVGELTTRMPRGLAALLRLGVPAWMRACTALMPVTTSPTADTTARSSASSSPPAEMVTILAEMALGGLRRCSA